jgi:hypothetical protein
MPKESQKHKRVRLASQNVFSTGHSRHIRINPQTPKALWSRNLRQLARHYFTILRNDEDEVIYRKKDTRRIKKIADSCARSHANDKGM